ncbi:reverse transcriptase family protein [Enterococcus gilvus]|uniref:reverse transcriptase family protein n=1 Tax=Enterococcus gilvus TaxID=160453 RepID=UPI003EDA0187
MMTKKLNFYELNQCVLYKCHSKKKLAEILKIPYQELKNISMNADTLYYQFSQPKKGTDELRKITAPNKELKKVQSSILSSLRRIEKPEWVISSTLKKSHLSNALYHKNSNYFCKTDIKKFYDNCCRDRVYRFFKDKLKTSPDVAKILTDLTTQDNIPTGCPSSQLIAYFAYEDMFSNIKTIAEKYDCKMTLYVDDIVFSNTDAFNHKSLMREVENEIRHFGHRLKSSKTKYYTENKGVPITGVIIRNNFPYVPNNNRQSIVENFSLIRNSQKISEKEFKSLYGKINAARLIENNHFNGIISYLKQNKPK